MKILVAVKLVPDTETKVRIGSDGRTLDESGIKWVVSPYDEFAIEEALRIRDGSGGEVVVVSAGREAAQAVIRQALAVGADRGILIADDRLERADAVVRARAIAAVVREVSAELLLTGKYGVGTDEWQTGPMVAELLGWPHAPAVSKLGFEGRGFTAESEVEGAREVMAGTLPAVITCEKGLNEPRYPSLKGIMQAKKKPIETRSAQSLGIDDAALDTTRLVWEALELPPSRKAGRRFEGEPEQAARALVAALRAEAKVI